MKNGIHFPAEWEEQSFSQVTFPHKHSDWKYLLEPVSKCFVEIIQTISQYQDVLVICENVDWVKSFFKQNNQIYFIQAHSNDTWVRDYGGITILSDKKPIINDFIFNGWGNKFNSRLDNTITNKLFTSKVFLNSGLKSYDFVLEGGSIESDGNGSILTTSKCLLSKNRNEQYTKTEIENIMKNVFGAQRILWINHGYLTGDDTDSHIDTLARFCNKNTIIYTGCKNHDDEHFDSLNKMKMELQMLRTADGKPYNLRELPLPDPCFDEEGNRLPATYANFVIINNAVLVPVYNVPQDREAVEIIKNCFPEMEIVSINCRVLIEQHGSLHCVTMQYPEPVKLNVEILEGNE